MLAREIRRRYIDFFVKKHNHAEIPGASLFPENDPTVLFTTAGMHPLVPYLMGEAHPAGKRLVNCQKCVRTDDIDEVGDKTHCTFFEMMGNWSLGDYFKEGAIKMSHEFLTSSVADGGLGIDSDRLHVSCFVGDKDAPLDEDAATAWESLGFKRAKTAKKGEKRLIYFYGKKENWWGPAGQTGPCGPDTEIFFDTGHESCGENCQPSCDCGRYVEIWNNVFMEFNKTAEGFYEPLIQKNVDTGLGLERVTAIMQGKETCYETELFQPILDEILKNVSQTGSEKSVHSSRIIADHIRAATFILGDPMGVTPSNTDQGYVLRRLIRRAIRHGRMLGDLRDFLPALATKVIEIYGEIYPELEKNRDFILGELKREEAQFNVTLERGLKEMKKMWEEGDALKKEVPVVEGEKAFFIYETYGFPYEMICEELKLSGYSLDDDKFCRNFGEAMKKHQELSRSGAGQKFAGGLADHSGEVRKLHTATHLLHQALREVLGGHVQQKGSNITGERLRFDFTHPDPMTPEQIKKVEEIVNGKIAENLPITCGEMTVDSAKSKGAIGLFEERYGELVKVYEMGDYSKEICGGPHAASTGELKSFKIKKEQSSSKGVRRIKATIGE